MIRAESVVVLDGIRAKILLPAGTNQVRCLDSGEGDSRRITRMELGQSMTDQTSQRPTKLSGKSLPKIPT